MPSATHFPRLTAQHIQPLKTILLNPVAQVCWFCSCSVLGPGRAGSVQSALEFSTQADPTAPSRPAIHRCSLPDYRGEAQPRGQAACVTKSSRCRISASWEPRNQPGSPVLLSALGGLSLHEGSAGLGISLGISKFAKHNEEECLVGDQKSTAMGQSTRHPFHSSQRAAATTEQTVPAGICPYARLHSTRTVFAKSL